MPKMNVVVSQTTVISPKETDGTENYPKTLGPLILTRVWTRFLNLRTDFFSPGISVSSIFNFVNVMFKQKYTEISTLSVKIFQN